MGLKRSMSKVRELAKKKVANMGALEFKGKFPELLKDPVKKPKKQPPPPPSPTTAKKKPRSKK